MSASRQFDAHFSACYTGGERPWAGRGPSVYPFRAASAEEVARYYSPLLGRFLSADTVVPQPGNPQDFNRYSYTNNNPIRFIDPSGHFTDDAIKSYLTEFCKDGHSYCGSASELFEKWSKDQAWMDLLHAAVGGDVLAMMNTYDDSQMKYFKFEGKGKDVLTGVSEVAGVSGKSIENGHDNLKTIRTYWEIGFAEAGLWAQDESNNLYTAYHMDDRVGIWAHTITQDEYNAKTIEISSMYGVLQWGLQSGRGYNSWLTV